MAVTRSFVVKNGLEVAEDLIYTKDSKVGIATTVPNYTLHVNGDIFFKNNIYIPSAPGDVNQGSKIGIVSSTSLGSITGIDTTGLFIGDNVEGDFIQFNTKVISIGSSTLGILPNHTNTIGIATTTFNFFRYNTAGKPGNALISAGPGNPSSWGEPVASFATTAKNVIGGIGSISQLEVGPGITTVSFLEFDFMNSPTGIITASKFIGVAETSRNVIGGIGSITQLSVGPGITTLANIDSSGTLDVEGQSTLADVEADSYRVGSGPSLTNFQIDNYNLFAKTGTFTAVVGLAVTIDSFTGAENYKTAEYTIVLETSSSMQAQKVLVMQNGTNAFSEEYAIIYNPNVIVAIGATLTGIGTCNLEVTPVTGTSGIVTYSFVRNTIR